MIDISILRENPDLVRKMLRDRNLDPKSVDAFLALDEKWRKAVGELDGMRANLKRESEARNIEAAKLIKPKIKEAEAALDSVATERIECLSQFPNLLDSDVPIGKDAEANVVIRSWGKPPVFKFTPKDHLTLGTELGIIDTEKASRIAGARFAYLFREAALLEFAIIQYAFDFLTSERKLKAIAKKIGKGYPATPFIPALPPVMIRPDVFRKMARLSKEDADERYYLPADDAFLIGSAEHTLGPLHMDEVIPESELPIRYVGFSTSFRREAGSYGKDTKGILRVHQFDKVEMESFSLPEESRKEQDFFVAIQEELLQGLELPYQVVANSSGDMGKPDARQFDIETWMPGQGRYRETHSADLMKDFQARRLNTKVKRKDGTQAIVHMNDATVFAIGRTLIAIIENYQTAEGTVKIPKALVKYVGVKEIKRKI